MLKRILIVAAVAVSAAVSAAAQENGQKPSQSKPAQSEPPQPAPPGPAGRAANVKLDLTITDQAGPGEPSKKVVTMIVASGHNGAIRTRGFQPRPGNPPREVIINVDAQPTITIDGPIRVQLGLEYSPVGPADAGNTSADPGRSSLNERIVFMISPGKPLVVSQAVDPLSDRRITIELTATIMK